MRSRGVNTWQRALFRIQRRSLTCCIYCKWGKTAECKVPFFKKKKREAQSTVSQQTGSPACELLFFWHIFQLGCVTHYTHALTLSFISSNIEQNIKNLAGDSAAIFQLLLHHNWCQQAEIVMNLHVAVSSRWSVYDNTCNSTENPWTHRFPKCPIFIYFFLCQCWVPKLALGSQNF